MASPERLKARKWYAKAYRGSESGKATRDSYRVEYAKTGSCKESRAKASAKYAKTEQGKAINTAASRKFVATDAGKALSRKHCGRRRARKLDSLCECCDPDERDQIYSMLWKDAECYVCSAKAEATDHVIPLHAEGLHCIKNFKSICTPCNSGKGYSVWPGQPGWKDFERNAQAG
jgi:5-methylcytosine-specific restriction endonuclease McrA